MIAPAQGAGPHRSPAPQQEGDMIRFGIVGMGIRGKLYAHTLAQSPHANLAAVADTNPETLAAVCRDFTVEGFRDSHELIDKAAIDAVIIATPDFQHRDSVVRAAVRGLHMLVEKPFSTSVAESDEMVAAIESHGVKCQVAFLNRWSQPIVTAKNSIAGGAIGAVLNINTRLNDTIHVPTAMLSWAGGSSVGWFLFPHLADLVGWFSGSTIESVYAVGTKKKLISMGIDTYDTIQATLNAADGTHSTITSSWVLPNGMPQVFDFKMEIIGTDGALYIDLQNQMVTLARDSMKYLGSMNTEINGQAIGGSNMMLHSFIDCIRLDTPPSVTHRDGATNTRIVSAIHESVATGNVVRVL
jgi:predicted dehydrogenase